MKYLGDFPAEQAIYFAWNTSDADGASITRATDGTISVYKDNSDGSSFDTTQVTTGVTNAEDFDSLTGVHTCCITTTDAWYETGHDYMVVLSAATIDGQTVNAVLAHFSIENRFMRGTDSAYTGTPPTATAIVDEWESQSQSDPTGFHVNVKEVNGTSQTAGDIGAKTGFKLASDGLDQVLMEDLASVPAANGTVKAAINWIFEVCRNKMVTNKTNQEIEVYKDDASTVFAESDIADDGNTFTRGKFGSVD